MPATLRPTSAFRMNDWAVRSQCGMWVWANNYFRYGVRPEEVHAEHGDTDPRMHNRALPLEPEWACIQRAGGTVPAHFPVPMPYVRRDVDHFLPGAFNAQQYAFALDRIKRRHVFADFFLSLRAPTARHAEQQKKEKRGSSSSEEWRPEVSARLADQRCMNEGASSVVNAERKNARLDELSRRIEDRVNPEDVSIWRVLETQADSVAGVSVQSVARDMYRRGSGLTPSTFVPQRHSYFVCGRPVQVHMCIIIKPISRQPLIYFSAWCEHGRPNRHVHLISFIILCCAHGADFHNHMSTPISVANT